MLCGCHPVACLNSVWLAPVTRRIKARILAPFPSAWGEGGFSDSEIFAWGLRVRFDADFSAGWSFGVFRPLAALFFRIALFFEPGFVEPVVASRPATLAVRGCPVGLVVIYVSFLRFRRMTIHHSNGNKTQVKSVNRCQDQLSTSSGLQCADRDWREVSNACCLVPPEKMRGRVTLARASPKQWPAGSTHENDCRSETFRDGSL